MTEVTISFPGIGIGEFTVDKVAFSLSIGKFDFDVRWYGIIVTLGIIAGVLYTLYRSKHEGISSEDVLDFSIWTVLLAIIGARIYYVLTTLKTDSGEWNYHSFTDVIAVWEGGIAIYGGIIGGALGIWVVSKIKKYNKTQLLKMTDMVAPGVMLGQIIGRWGNFINGEAHGVETAETFFLRMGLMLTADRAPAAEMHFYHPTFFYESLWNFAGFCLLHWFSKHRKYDGQIALGYVAWYGLGRTMIEGLRTDSLYWGAFRVSQLLAAVSCFVAILIMGLLSFKHHSPENLYVNQVAALEEAEEADEDEEEAESEEEESEEPEEAEEAEEAEETSEE